MEDEEEEEEEEVAERERALEVLFDFVRRERKPKGRGRVSLLECLLFELASDIGAAVLVVLGCV